jgi:hypothetical protein
MKLTCIKPKIMIVAIDATEDCTEELINKAGRIADIYYFNQNEVTHCCKFTPSYWLEYVTSISKNSVEGLYEELESANSFADCNSHYVHCHSLDNNSKVKLLQDFEELDEEEWLPKVDKYGLDCFVREWCRPDEFYEPGFLPWKSK